MTLGPIFFAAPWALAALAALPLLWLVLRAAPPAPRKQIFPPLRLLLGLRTAEETTGRPPWWLLLVRALAAALLIIGFARPSLAPEGAEAATLSGPMLIVIDDGWPGAAGFDAMRTAADGLIARAERSRQSIYLLTTAPTRGQAQTALDALTPADARAVLARLEPKPWRPDRAAALTRLAATPQRFAEVQWFIDGVSDSALAGFAEALAARGPVIARSPARTAVAVIDAQASAKGLDVKLRRAGVIGGDGAVAADTIDARPLGAASYTFPPGQSETTVVIPLPPEIAARAARVRIVGERSAAAVRLIPSAAGRPVVGLIDPSGQSQPLTSELFYVDRAIEPFASTRRGPAGRLIDDGAQVLVLPDASRLAPGEQRAVQRWLDGGGVLIRFAGPRLANDSDDLSPAPLRRGARQLGGALAWETPQRLRPFEQSSPFFGLEPPQDVTVSKHVMLAAESETTARVWAQLADGAPIITAAARGRGLIVLFHVGGGPDWSNLPLSGLFVELLRRTIGFAGRTPGRALDAEAAAGPYLPRRMIDGFGAWAPPAPDTPPIPADQFDAARAAPMSPPGLYDRGATFAIQTVRGDEVLAPIGPLPGVTMASLDAAPSRPLSGWFLGLGGVLIALDLLLALWLSGRLAGLRFGKTAAGVMIAVALTFASAPHAMAQRGPAQTVGAADADIQLAFVRTGDAATDATMKAGLDQLARVLRERTAVEPGPTVAVDLARDDLSLFPLLYWLAPPAPRALPDAALENLDRYMRLGGMVFIDTRDPGRSGGAGPAAVMLRGLDAPPLEAITQEHVLTKAFYLLQGFPGRVDNATVFAETPSAAAARDGVPALLIGNGDWASLWAQATARDNVAWFDDSARRRELAMRFGVNLVMVALTGNYKADQVHVPALLERLGQEGPRR